MGDRTSTPGPVSLPATERAEALLMPFEFDAVAVKEYDLPALKPAIVHVCAPVVDQVAPPG